MLTTYDLRFNMSNEEKAIIVKKLIKEGKHPIYEILVPIKEVKESGRSLIYFITGSEFKEKHKDLFKEVK